jgi:hypothetical protein
MKKLIISAMIVLTVSNYSTAADKTPLRNVDIDALTIETQGFMFPEAGDDHLAFVWWIPNEFWEATLSQDTTISKTDQDEILEALSGISLLAVIQADMTYFGAFKFYSKEEIEKQMLVSFTGVSGKRQKISLKQTLNPDLEILLGALNPILGAAMGNMGDNFHFYVLNDKSNFSYRLLNPYRKGQLNVQLAKRNDELMIGSLEMPLNSLFIPRKCPNGKNAHISWKFCPWTGIRLEE